MAKFYGIVGYGVTQENLPGSFVDTIVERRPYYGDILRSRKSIQGTEDLNDDVNVTNEISIVADPFAYQHCYAIRYVEYMGAKWKVRDVEIKRPRLILSLGGIYNDQ